MTHTPERMEDRVDKTNFEVFCGNENHECECYTDKEKIKEFVRSEIEKVCLEVIGRMEKEQFISPDGSLTTDWKAQNRNKVRSEQRAKLQRILK